MPPDEWRVLLVEDEYDSIQLVSKILRYNGAKVYVAHNGYECLALVEELKPTLIIMDLGLPKMNGWETLAKLRDNPKTRAIPVMAITAYHSVSVEEDALVAGFDAFYPKPLDAIVFMEKLHRLVDR